MKRAHAILAVILALSLTGCVLRRKPAVRSAAPPPRTASTPSPATPPLLSTPQTQVELPPAQPVPPEALATVQESEQPAESTPVPKSPRRAGPAGPPPRTEPPAQPPAQQTEPAQAPAAEPERPAIGEILPPEEQRRLHQTALEDKRAIRQIVDQAQTRRLSKEDRGRVTRIEQFVKLSEEAEGGGNMRQAAELAHRGLILARELQVGR